MPKTTRLPAASLPFLTLPDPPVAGEGALDPLGLATAGERLADWILPGMTARMIRPRFLTAIAVSAVVCEGLQDEIAADGVTPAYLVFEWLLVEGFARAAERSQVERTPGIDKARTCSKANLRMCSRTYLKTPSVFGFHGVYRRLARHIGIIDQHDILQENGYRLVKSWEREQGIEGFQDSANATSGTASRRQLLRSAVLDALKAGYADRSGGWQGWQFFAQHLAPANVGRLEAQFLRSLLLAAKTETRGELFQLLEVAENYAFAEGHNEAETVHCLLPQTSSTLAHRLRAIIAYEEFCTLLETGFEWLRWLSSTAGPRAISATDFASEPEACRCAELLLARLQAAERGLQEAPSQALSEFSELARYFDGVSAPNALLESLLYRHAEVQKAKPPEGKRPWYEHAENGGVFVRPPYRLEESPTPREWWARPYRLGAVFSFCRDLKRE